MSAEINEFFQEFKSATKKAVQVYLLVAKAVLVATPKALFSFSTKEFKKIIEEYNKIYNA